MINLEEEAKRIANESGHNLIVRRKSKLDPKKVKTLKVDPKVYLFTLSYARQNNLFLQEAADELLKIGINQVVNKKRKDILSPGKIMQFIQRKGPDRAEDNKPQK